MANLATQPKGLAVPKTPKELVASRMDKMIEALPGATETSIKRFKAAAIGVAMSPLVYDCTPESVFTAIYTCARLNLIPDPALKLAHIIPFKEKGVKRAQLIIGYQGYIELARRANPALIVRTGSVYENDEYILEDGVELVFRITKRAWEKGQANGQFLFSYCVSGTSGQEKTVKIISRQDGQKIAASKSDYTPWKKGGPLKESGVAVDFPAMCEKTAIRASSKLWSLDPEKESTKHFLEALAADENTERAEVGDLGDYGLGEIDVDANVVPNAPDAGNVTQGKVKPGTTSRKATEDELKRLTTLISDKLQAAGVEPTPEASYALQESLGINYADATLDKVMDWAAAIAGLDNTQLATSLRG